MDPNILQIIIKSTGGRAAAADLGHVIAASGKLADSLKRDQQTVLAFYGGISNKFAMAAGAMAVGMGGATVMASGFEEQLRNVNSLAQLDEQSFRELGRSVLDLVQDPHIKDGPTQLARGLYDIQSSGYEGALGLEVLEISAKGAAAGLSDTATAADVLTSVGNAYGARTGPELQRLMDVMFKTVDRGKVTFAELAQQIGPAAAVASQAGISFEQLSAAYATMTIQGINASESSTALERLITTFMNPPRELAKRFKEMGYESGLSILQTKGLVGAIELLDEAAGGDAAVLAQMGFEMRALRAMYGLTGEAAGTYTENLNLMENAAGATNAALEEQAKSTAFQWARTKAALQATAIVIGETYLPAVNKALGVTTALASGFSSLPKPVQQGAGAVIALVTGITGMIALESKARIFWHGWKTQALEVALAEGRLAAANVSATDTIIAQTVALEANAAAATTSAVALEGRAVAAGATGAGGVGGGAAAVGGAAAGGARSGGFLATMAPTTMALLTNPVVIAAATSAATYYYFYDAVVRKAWEKMAEVERREMEMQIGAEARGIGTFRPTATGEERLKPEDAAKFEPGGRWQDILPWIGGPVGIAAEAYGGVRSDWAEAERLQRLSAADRDRELQRIRTDDGEERYQWLAKRMPGVHPRKLTSVEQGAELARKRDEEIKQATRDRIAAAESEHMGQYMGKRAADRE
ncbi:MAG TPA: phage tail tape measure protein, partial [Armatimonadota bacterium]|nr:phage tail tape measure protein [Armatimonadota bacterium]